VFVVAAIMISESKAGQAAWKSGIGVGGSGVSVAVWVGMIVAVGMGVGVAGRISCVT
jgi:hypothetical protein